jgi:hypothetical protein
MSTSEAPDSTTHQGSPIPADEESVEIDVADVKYEQTYAPGTTTATSVATRPLEPTDIEGSFKRGVISALHQRPLFVLDKADITPSDATSFQLRASRWNNNFALNEVIVGRAVDLLQICIYADNAFTMLSEFDLPRWLDLLTVPPPNSSSNTSGLAPTAVARSPRISATSRSILVFSTPPPRERR